MNSYITDLLSDDTAIPAVEHEVRRAKTVGLVVVMSAKGGCGATLLAANLAADLAANRRVCLVDLDLCKGDVAAYLDLHSDHTLNLLLDNHFDMDAQMLRGSIDVHPSGLHVLSQPYDLTELHQVSADEVSAVLSFIRANYDVVVVDAGSRVDVATLTAAMLADEVVLVTTTDVVALRDAQRVVGLLRRIDVPPSHIRLVLNKHVPGAGVSVAHIAEQLHMPISAIVGRDDELCHRADTQGRLLRDLAPRAKITHDVGALWSTLRGQAAPTSAATGFWTLWARATGVATARASGP